MVAVTFHTALRYAGALPFAFCVGWVVPFTRYVAVLHLLPRCRGAFDLRCVTRCVTCLRCTLRCCCAINSLSCVALRQIVCTLPFPHRCTVHCDYVTLTDLFRCSYVVLRCSLLHLQSCYGTRVCSFILPYRALTYVTVVAFCCVCSRTHTRTPHAFWLLPLLRYVTTTACPLYTLELLCVALHTLPYVTCDCTLVMLLLLGGIWVSLFTSDYVTLLPIVPLVVHVAHSSDSGCVAIVVHLLPPLRVCV